MRRSLPSLVAFLVVGLLAIHVASPGYGAAVPHPPVDPSAIPFEPQPEPPPPVSAYQLPPPPPISTGDAIKTIIGLVVLLGLAYVGGHPAVQKLERRLRISQVITAGFPFVLLGLLARSDSVGILSDPVLETIRPVLPLGLGWIGFAVGFRVDVRRFEGHTPGLATAFALTTLLPFGAIVLAAGSVLALTEGVSADAAFLRDALILATAGAMTSRSVPGYLMRHGAEPEVVDRVALIIQLEELAAFAALVGVAAFFRLDLPPLVSSSWDLPGVGWVFLTLGIGAALSFVIFALMTSVSGGRSETLVVALGSIALAAGIAATLRLSPLVVCFLAGGLLANFPGDWKPRVKAAVDRFERPIYLLFLVLAGALWEVDAWEGWVMMALFVVARLAGRTMGVRLFTRRNPDTLSPMEQRYLAVSPMGALSVAIVVSAQYLYSGATVSWIVTAILAGAIVNEVVVQIVAFKNVGRRVSESALIAVNASPPVVADMPVPQDDDHEELASAEDQRG